MSSDRKNIVFAGTAAVPATAAVSVALHVDETASMERNIHRARADLLAAYVEYVLALDEGSQWSRIVESARRAGLPKQALCRELSCAWSTIMRWRAGQSAPGPYAKPPIKAKLVQMMEEMRLAELARAWPEAHTANPAAGRAVAYASRSFPSAPPGGGFPDRIATHVRIPLTWDLVEAPLPATKG